MHPLFALYRPPPTISGAFEAAAWQLSFLTLVGFCFYFVARRRFQIRQITIAVVIGGLACTLIGLVIAIIAHRSDNDPWLGMVRSVLSFFQERSFGEYAFLGMFLGWMALERSRADRLHLHVQRQVEIVGSRLRWLY